MNKPRPRVIYVMSDGPDRSKVGITTNLAQRLKSIRVNSLSLVAVEWHSEPREDAALVESVVHQALLDRRIAGEWFAVSANETIVAVQRAIVAVDSKVETRIRRLPDGRHESGIFR